MQMHRISWTIAATQELPGMANINKREHIKKV